MSYFKALELASYDNRVKSIADKIKSMSDIFKNKDEMKRYVVSKVQQEPEGRLSNPKASNEMVSDVWKLVKNSKTASEIKPDINKFIQKLATIVENAIGNSFPDGDPFDTILPKAVSLGKSYGIKDVQENIAKYLDKAAKIIGGYSSYHTLLKQTWQHIMDDMDDATLKSYGLDKKSNPWK